MKRKYSGQNKEQTNYTEAYDAFRKEVDSGKWLASAIEAHIGRRSRKRPGKREIL